MRRRELLDDERIIRAVRGADVVSHCAAKRPGKAPPEQVWQVGVTGTANLLAGCAAGGRRGRLTNVTRHG
ncbi:MAG: hypothetical protein ACOC8F_06505 [Planctomycetota bacterium]